MIHGTRIAALLVVALLCWLSLSALAFTQPTPTSKCLRRKDRISNHHGSSLMQFIYQEGSEEETNAPPIQTLDNQDILIDVSKAPHIDDASYELILNNPLSVPVLIDCYKETCGPCKLIERSLKEALPKYITNNSLSFAKWDTETTDTSERFMSILREHNMTFRKLPTILLFMDGIPVAMNSGMMSAAAIDRFLEKHLPSDKPGKPRPKIGPDGALGVSTRKMNR